jgi:hypothetical protein
MRASDDRRERTVVALRDGALDGCLTVDTFATRVEAAYHARTEEELDRLLEDLPRPHGRLRSVAARLRQSLTRAPARQIEVLVPSEASAVTVGRSRDCDIVVGERTVSRFHAELRHGNGAWTVRDLDSTYGTWVNGARVREARVGRGDVLALGALRMELRI